MTIGSSSEPGGDRPARLLSVVIVLALWMLVTWSAAGAAGVAPMDTPSWDRWDSGIYQDIARDGYDLLPNCPAEMAYPPGSWCGTAGWFPLLPYSTRVLHSLGVPLSASMRMVVLAAFVTALAMAALGPLSTRSRSTAALAMCCLAMFPGAVYFGALFPISLALAGILGCLAAIHRAAWLAAGCAGAVATAAYPSGLLVITAAAAVLFDRRIGGRKRRLLATAAVAGPPLIAYAAVAANFRRTVGRWDAWFLVQAKYGHGISDPVSSLWRHLSEWSPNGDPPAAAAVQTALVLAAMCVAGVAVVRHRRDLSTAEWACAATSVAFWMVPLTIGGQLSMYRAEALVAPVVVLLARAPRRLLFGFIVVAAPVAFAMSRHFFENLLV